MKHPIFDYMTVGEKDTLTFTYILNLNHALTICLAAKYHALLLLRVRMSFHSCSSC